MSLGETAEAKQKKNYYEFVIYLSLYTLFVYIHFLINRGNLAFHARIISSLDKRSSVAVRVMRRVRGEKRANKTWKKCELRSWLLFFYIKKKISFFLDAVETNWLLAISSFCVICLSDSSLISYIFSFAEDTRELVFSCNLKAWWLGTCFWVCCAGQRRGRERWYLKGFFALNVKWNFHYFHYFCFLFFFFFSFSMEFWARFHFWLFILCLMKRVKVPSDENCLKYLVKLLKYSTQRREKRFI